MKKKSIAIIGTAIIASNPVIQPAVVLAEQTSVTGQTDTEGAKGTLESELDTAILNSDTVVAESSDSMDAEQTIDEEGTSEDASKKGDTESEVTEESTTDEETEKSEEENTAKLEKSSLQTDGIKVGINAPTKFQTYTDPVSGVKPTELTVALAISISQADVEGATIEIPYGFTPDPSNPTFKHFTMTDAIFSFVDPGVPSEDSIVESYEEKLAENKLVIHLKKTATTVETLNLRFKFNDDYNAKIPADQIIWEGLKATTYDSDQTEVASTDAMNVESNTRDGFSVTMERFNPTDEKYTSGPISTRGYLFNRFNQYSLLDMTNEDINQMWVQVPTGSSLNSVYTNTFGTDGKTSVDNSEIPVGYTRFSTKMKDATSSFPVWAYAGDVNDNRRMVDAEFTPPSSIQNGETFNVTLGMTYKKINGKVTTVEGSKEYIKSDLEEWNLYNPATNSTGGSKEAMVTVGDPSSVSISMNTGYAYIHNQTTKNVGKKPIKNAKATLFQDETVSSKINYESVVVVGLIDTNDSSAVQGHYRTEVVIKNAKTSATRKVDGGLGTTKIEVGLPNLNENEFISEIVVVPMGTDGQTEGELPSKNGFRINYTAKNWDSNTWPDGTKIAMDSVTKATTYWTFDYDDEKDGKLPTPASKKSNIGNIYYAPAHTTDAYVSVTSSDATDRKPGETVHYNINGYNTEKALGNWTNPEVRVSIPKQLQLQNPDTYKEYKDLVSGVDYPDSVKVTLLSSDSRFNYYKFEATGIAKKNGTSPSFSIPLELKVVSGTKVGKYDVAYATASHNIPTFSQMRITNNLGDSVAESFGFDNSVLNSYTASGGHTPLSVVYATKLSGGTAGRKGSSDDWSNTTNFAVEKGGTPQMKATIQNTGNTNFSNVRLYDILPSSNDGRGSTGNVSFAGLESVDGATVYYTTKAVSELPNYESNLQSWDAAKIASYGFTTTKPADVTDVTAVFIDFGLKVVAPNNSLDTVLNFLIPDADNQKAINQFQYSAKEEGSGTTLNAKSDSIVFSTEVAQINFDQNLPDYLPAGVENATDIPESQSELLDVNGDGSVTIPDKVPTLTGYDFVKWVDKDDDKKEYQPGDIIDFTSSSSKTTVDLKAVWRAKTVKVTYNENFGSKPNEVTKEYGFGNTVNLSEVAVPKRTGYEFVGWSNSNVATVEDFKDGEKISFTSDKTVYAIWKANTYTISFDANGGTGTMADLPMIYDVEKAIPENTFSRKNYIFQGWSTKDSGSKEFQDKGAVKNLTDKANGSVTLYAVWKLDQTEIVVKDSTIYVGETWTPEDNFVSAKDEDGKPVAFDKVTAPNANEVDTATLGDYEVTYSYNGKEAKATIHVVDSKETLKAKDVTIYEGDSWDAEDNFVSATDKDGKAVAFSAVGVTGADAVDTANEGTYKVTYTYGKQTVVGNVIVLKNQTNILTKDSTIYVGGSWDPADNFVSATDKDGSTVDFSKITGPANNAVNVAVVGDYEVTYKYNGKEAKATIHVVANQETLTVKDVTIYQGDTWTAADNFVNATTKDGMKVEYKDITVTGDDLVDVNQEGSYNVTYVYGGQTAIGKVTVLKNQTSIVAKDSTIYVNSSWSPADNFVSATDKTGAAVDFSQITAPASNAVNSAVVGDYEVTYKYSGKEAKATIHVVANQETLTVKDVTIYEGEAWKAEDNFVGATTKDGDAVAFKDIKVTNANLVNTGIAGDYEVTYAHGDQTAVGKVTVLKNQTSVVAKDSTIYEGSSWDPADNFVSATDKTGASVDFSQITPPASDAVNVSKVGNYEITYSYNGKETKVTVHVVKNQETLTIRDITIYEGDDWKVEDNFVSATAKDGSIIAFEKVKTTGDDTVDPSKEGIYEVIYEYGDQQATGKVTVLKNQTSITAKDSTIYTGGKWSPEDNFVGATDKAGTAVAFDQVTAPAVTAVDVDKVGDYEVTYSYKAKEAKATVHVVENQETLTVRDVTIYEGDEWKAEDNFINATTKDGSEVSFKDVKVTGDKNVDSKKAGTYQLTFTQGDISQTANVIVLKDKSSITVKDTVIYIGGTWEAKDNFVSATDRYGNGLELSDLTVSGEVDMSKIGTYEVTYALETSKKASRAGGTELPSSLAAIAKIQVLNNKKGSTTNTTDSTTPVKTGQNDKLGNTSTNIRSNTLPDTASRTVTSSQKSYPQTGETNSIVPIVSGASLISIASIIAWFRRKRKRG
ncbi:bacterial Ig-like domain-containing protein [Enterococcus sp. AZ196]|uniref:bacterial Ig-like domain-containing protein n=1 Tax=Enterococcus sp. AZ196 TaxID=2774659 RepID=UPI003D2A6375